MIRTPVIFAACLAHLAIFASGVAAQSGACCLDGGSCFVGAPASCAGAFPPGAYQGDGSTCATALCGGQGACCFPDGTCQDLFWGPCDTSTGTFQGDGSSCTPNVCPPPAPVPTQINHQGVVSVNGQRFTGNGQFYFAIIDPATGNSVWTNDATNIGTANRPNRPVVIPCVSGLYSMRLGDQSLTNMKLVPVGAFSSENRSLRIWFDDGTNGVHQLTPDHALTSGPYAMRAAEAPSGVPITRVYTSNDAWVKPQGLKYVEVEVVGGGGGGGGTSTGGGSSPRAAGGGGGGGGYAKKVISPSSLGSTEPIVIGTGGSGGTGAVGGGSGGNSSFGSHLSASGGSGGAGDNGAPSFSQIPGGAGGFGSGGDLNFAGEAGGYGTWAEVTPDIAISGKGGDSVWGFGGKKRIDWVDRPGDAGASPGGGGSGSAGDNNGVTTGGAGAPGVVIVKEFF